jgi:hypothetical protein
MMLPLMSPEFAKAEAAYRQQRIREAFAANRTRPAHGIRPGYAFRLAPALSWGRPKRVAASGSPLPVAARRHLFSRG